MAEAATKEPSMEDILSSIRKIIAEEEATGAPAAGQAEEMQQPVDEVSTPSFEEPVPEFNPAAPQSVHSVADPAPASMEAYDPALRDGEQTTVAPNAEPVMDVQSAFQADDLVVSSEPEPVSVVPTPSQNVQETSEVSLASIAAGVQESEVPLPPATGEPQMVAVEDSVLSSLEHDMQPIIEQELNGMVEEASLEPDELPVTETSMAPTEVSIDEEEPAPVDMSAAVSAPSPNDMAKEEEAFRGALMSPSADGAVAGAFDRLKRSAMDDVEAKTEAILRPMLREWLDENLPKLVEKLVREEIERVARG